MRIKEHKTQSGWPEFEFVGVGGGREFEAVADWLRREARAWHLTTVDDPLGDTRYWDFWLGGLSGGRVVLHFEIYSGTVLYATGRRSSRALQALRPRLEQAQRQEFIHKQCACAPANCSGLSRQLPEHPQSRPSA